MTAMAAKTGEKNVPVTIESRKTKELSFVFTPEGTISGYVITVLKPEDRPAGMPADRYLPADKKITIQTMTLSGAGIQRTLQPLEGEGADYIDYMIAHADFSYNGPFFLFGLPAGVYELVIHAQGYEPSRQKYSVMPGKQDEQRVTELTPDRQEVR